MVYAVIRSCATKGDEVPGYQAPIRENLFDARGRGIHLETQVVASTTHGNDEGDQVGDPGPPLPGMDCFEAEKRHGEGHEAHDDDTDARADTIWIQGGERLSANDGRDETEACYRGSI